METIREATDQTTAWLIPTTPTTREIAEEERRAVVSRDIQVLDPSDLMNRETPEGSWMIGVLCDPNTSLDGISQWARKMEGGELVQRVHFYHLPQTNLTDLFAPWFERGLPDPKTNKFSSWAEFHKKFGLDLNDIIYQDAAGGDESGQG